MGGFFRPWLLGADAAADASEPCQDLGSNWKNKMLMFRYWPILQVSYSQVDMMTDELQDVLQRMIRRATVDPEFWRTCVRNPDRAFRESSDLVLEPEDRATFNRALAEGIPWFAPSARDGDTSFTGPEPEDSDRGFLD